MIKIFISGPLFGPNVNIENYMEPSSKKIIYDNINKAEILAFKILKLGFAPFTPHLNFDEFELLCEEKEFPKILEKIMESCEEFIKCCDCFLLLPKWETSKGSKREYEVAKKLEKPIFYSIEELIKWRKKSCLGKK